MKFTAREIANTIGGDIVGNPEEVVNQVSKIEEGKPGSISFLANPKYNQFLYTTDASIVIVDKDMVLEQEVNCTLIKVDDAYSAFAKLLEVYNNEQKESGISSLAFIAEGVVLGDDVYIGEFSYVGRNSKIGNNVRIYPQVYIGSNVSIGDNTVLYPGVKIYNQMLIGQHCTIHAGVSIGSDGFGFAPTNDNNYKKIAQIGNVIIEDNVEIGANTTIDRATLGSTIIRKGAKLDNLIQIAHNVEIGENTIIASQTGIAGSTKIGKNCILAGQAGITGHLKIADNVTIGAQSGISTPIRKEGITLLGSPAFEISRYRKSYVHFRNLDKHISRIDALEAIINKHFKEG